MSKAGANKQSELQVNLLEMWFEIMDPWTTTSTTCQPLLYNPKLIIPSLKLMHVG